MRKFSFLFILAICFSLASCVDKAYDLNDINTDDITVGKEFVAPIGTLTIDITDYLDLIPAAPAAPELITKAPQEVNMTDFSIDWNIEAGGIDPGLVDALTDSGPVTIIAKMKNILPVSLALKVVFIHPTAGEITAIDGSIMANQTGTLTTTEITKAKLTQIAESDQVRCSIVNTTGGSFSVDLATLGNIEISLSIKKTGGIKL